MSLRAPLLPGDRAHRAAALDQVCTRRPLLQIEEKAADLQAAISEGANSFLFTEYKYVSIFMVSEAGCRIWVRADRAALARAALPRGPSPPQAGPTLPLPPAGLLLGHHLRAAEL